MTKVNHRRGYVLLLVMLVLALAAAAMSAVCRMSLEKAVTASRAQLDLQQRWAVVSCRAVMLPKAQAVLGHDGNSASEVRRSVRLGGQAFTLVFGDEQAKANVNLLYARSNLGGAERSVRSIAASVGGTVPVELRPIPGRGQTFGSPDAADDDLPAFESFEQMLGHTPPDVLLSIQGNRGSLTSQLTCWGDGSLNLRRAPAESVRAALGSDLPDSDISRLLNARAKNPGADSGELLDGLDLPAARRDRVDYLLSDDSSCHSLWIISDSGGRNRYDLSIAEGSTVILFSW